MLPNRPGQDQREQGGRPRHQVTAPDLRVHVGKKGKTHDELNHQSDERKDDNENRQIEKRAMPDPAMNRPSIEEHAHGKKNEQGDEQIARKRRDEDALEIDFLVHDL